MCISLFTLPLPQIFAQFLLLSFLESENSQDFAEISCKVCLDRALFPLFGEFVPRTGVHCLFLVNCCEFISFFAIVRVHLIDFVLGLTIFV